MSAFADTFTVTSSLDGSSEATIPSGAVSASEFVREFGGRTYNFGLYRTHTEGSARAASAWVQAAFPDFAYRKVQPFGFDWAGRQFTTDPTRGPDQGSFVTMFDPGTGEALSVDMGIGEFHEVALAQFPEDSLQLSRFLNWHAASGDQLTNDQCLGYVVPIFLGGSQDPSNREITDIEVYWVLSGQLRVQTLGLPPNTDIGPVTQG